MEVFPKFWFKDCLIIWQKAFKKLNTNNKMKNKNSSPAQQFTETSNFGFWEKKRACQTSYSHSFAGRKNKFSASKIKVSPLITRLLACWQCASANQSHRPQSRHSEAKWQRWQPSKANAALWQAFCSCSALTSGRTWGQRDTQGTKNKQRNQHPKGQRGERTS